MNSNQRTWLTPQRALTVYAAVFSAYIAWASLRTALDPGPHGFAVRILAIVEIVGAIFFAIPKTRFIGVATLIVIFSIAAGIELHLHEWPVRFVFYVATALFAQYLSVSLGNGARQRERSEIQTLSS